MIKLRRSISLLAREDAALAFYHACSSIATARVHPAEPPRTLTGKQLTVKPVAGRLSRLCSFSMWQYPISRPALCPSQIRLASRVAGFFSFGVTDGLSQLHT